MNNRIKRAILDAIENGLDEVTIPEQFRRTPDEMGFIEVYGPFVHVADKGDHYFQIFLKEISERDFDMYTPYDPEEKP